MFDHLFLNTFLATVCPAGINGPGGSCACENNPIWDQDTWTNPWCDKGLCKVNQPYQLCQGKANGHLLGDGTWCWDEKRGAQCPFSARRSQIHEPSF